MKHPVLTVRKDIPVYDDEAPSIRPARRRPALPPRRRRSLLGRLGRAIVIPAVVVLVIAAAVILWLPRPGSAHFPGWDARMAAAAEGQQVVLTFTFTARSSRPGGAIVHIRAANPETGDTVDIDGGIAAPGTVLTGSLPLVGVVRALRADITVDGVLRTVTLGAQPAR